MPPRMPLPRFLDSLYEDEERMYAGDNDLYEQEDVYADDNDDYKEQEQAGVDQRAGSELAGASTDQVHGGGSQTGSWSGEHDIEEERDEEEERRPRKRRTLESQSSAALSDDEEMLDLSAEVQLSIHILDLPISYFFLISYYAQ
ncbi:hypothetical protein VKT23_013633 [Stygiomarasmius scandens]|uniref:Uncharacterized protein n=1 Tax=Marasmiellus scandens TaxID=2682957 RepID=A0ABR1J484_9AGAR